MFKIAIEAPGVILVSLLLTLNIFDSCSGVLFADFQHLSAAFKTTFSVTTVKLTENSFQLLPIFSHRVPS